MPACNKIPLNDVQTLLSYDKATGTLVLKDPDTPRKVCRPHTTSQWSIHGKHYSTHRLIWALHNPDNPNPRYVEHLDGDLDNHCIENLAEGLFVGVGGALKKTISRPRGPSAITAEEARRLPSGITYNPTDNTYDVAYSVQGHLVVVGEGYASLKEAAAALRIHRQMRVSGQIPTFDNPLSRAGTKARAAEDAALRALPEAHADDIPQPNRDTDADAPAYTKLPAAKMTPAQRRAKMRDLLNGTFDPNKDYTAPDPSEPDPDEKIASIIKSLPKVPARPTTSTTAPATDASSPDDDDDWTSIFDAHGFKPAG